MIDLIESVIDNLEAVVRMIHSRRFEGRSNCGANYHTVDYMDTHVRSFLDMDSMDLMAAMVSVWHQLVIHAQLEEAVSMMASCIVERLATAVALMLLISIRRLVWAAESSLLLAAALPLNAL